MKTSKIIFITLLATIALYILVAMIDVRINGQKYSEFNNRLKVNNIDLPSFSVIYLNNCKNITLIKRDSSNERNIKLFKINNSHIEVSVKEDSTAPHINYSIKEDTLRIMDFQKPASSFIFVKVYIGNELKTIQLKNSDIRIYNSNSEILSLVLDKSKVYFSSASDSKSSIGLLNIISKNQSSVTANSVNVDSVGIVLQNSAVTLSVSAKMLSGTLSDSSKLVARQPLEISLKRDATSKITISGN